MAIKQFFEKCKRWTTLYTTVGVIALTFGGSKAFAAWHI